MSATLTQTLLTQCFHPFIRVEPRFGAGAIGVFLGLSGLVAIVRNWEYGSRIENESFVWWMGYPPRRENRIPIREIKYIQITVDNDNDPRLKLFDLRDNDLRVPEQCIPKPWEEWAEYLGVSCFKSGSCRNSDSP